ncbi:hypothetical protein VISP3789_01539 [Vibrio splendidus ATCC 33789]|nr:hypothetical protein VISP3789_01539 [Vibrio splendidus ATCC 33789]
MSYLPVYFTAIETEEVTTYFSAGGFDDFNKTRR